MNPQSGSEAHRSKIDWLGLIRAYGRVVVMVAILVAVIIAVIGVAYAWRKGSQMVAFLEFRPTFTGMAELKYPNLLPFSANDVTEGSIVDLVYDSNNLGTVCNRETFRAGFLVDQRSDQSVLDRKSTRLN